ncbi:hypothetical protein TNCV_37981 [Trichonephila clavipes]|nr:hypothetical protein TNCV_37981 [Trichonephila clavipes]
MEPECGRRLQLFVAAKTLTGGQEFLVVQENLKIVDRKIRAVGGMIYNSQPNSVKTAIVRRAVCGRALSRRSTTHAISIPRLLF